MERALKRCTYTCTFRIPGKEGLWCLVDDANKGTRHTGKKTEVKIKDTHGKVQWIDWNTTVIVETEGSR